MDFEPIRPAILDFHVVSFERAYLLCITQKDKEFLVWLQENTCSISVDGRSVSVKAEETYNGQSRLLFSEASADSEGDTCYNLGSVNLSISELTNGCGKVDCVVSAIFSSNYVRDLEIELLVDILNGVVEEFYNE